MSLVSQSLTPLVFLSFFLYFKFFSSHDYLDFSKDIMYYTMFLSFEYFRRLNFSIQNFVFVSLGILIFIMVFQYLSSTFDIFKILSAFSIGVLSLYLTKVLDSTYGYVSGNIFKALVVLITAFLLLIQHHFQVSNQLYFVVFFSFLAISSIILIRKKRSFDLNESKSNLDFIFLLTPVIYGLYVIIERLSLASLNSYELMFYRDIFDRTSGMIGLLITSFVFSKEYDNIVKIEVKKINLISVFGLLVSLILCVSLLLFIEEIEILFALAIFSLIINQLNFIIYLRESKLYAWKTFFEILILVIAFINYKGYVILGIMNIFVIYHFISAFFGLWFFTDVYKRGFFKSLSLLKRLIICG
jgi:hypothetical protein